MLSNLTPEDWEVNVKRTVWKEDGWHRFGLKRYCLSRLCLGIALVWGKWVPEKLLTIHTQLEERVDIKRGACCFESRVNVHFIPNVRPEYVILAPADLLATSGPFLSFHSTL